MPKKQVQNIEVRLHGSLFQGKLMGLRYSLSCEYDGARYHVWLDYPNRALQDETLFKNPPLGVEYRGDGYFPTRRLSAVSGFSASLISTMREVADRDDLWTKAYQTFMAEQEAEQQKHDASVRAHKITKAAPELYEALKTISECGSIREAERIALEAIAKAEG